MNKGALFVTGGSSGIGARVIKKMQGDVGNIFNIDVQKPNESARNFAEHISADVRLYEPLLSAFMDLIVPEEVNYLFSNAGILFFLDPEKNIPVDFVSAPIELAEKMISINFMGTVNVVHAFIHALKEKRARGSIVVNSSISSFHSGGPNMAVYDATKAAISAFAQRLVPYNMIRVNVVEPGSVRTNIGSWKPDYSQNETGKKVVKEGQDSDFKRLGKEVSPNQVAEMVKFLLLENHGMNGARIVIDEGLTSMGREGY